MKKLFIFIMLLHSIYAHSEAFGNKIISLPTFGFEFIDSIALNKKKPLGISYDYLIGAKFAAAFDYDWYWISQSHVSFGSMSQTKKILSAINAGSGVKYNFSEKDLRVYSTLLINYLQFLGKAATELKNLEGWPIFVGLSSEIGLEWIFIDELSLSLGVDYGFYVNIHKPINHLLSFKSAFNIYF